MRTSASHRLTRAWAVLVTITVAYLAIDHRAARDGHPVGSTAATVLAITLGLVKVRLILRELMDVRHAPAVLRRCTDLLVGTMGAALLGTYVVGHALA